jgi:hypothetical protein
MNDTSSIDYKKATPIKQGLVVIALILIFDLFSLAGGVGEDGFFKPSIFWINTIAFLLVYSLFNSILSLSSEDQNKYWGQSIATFAGICIIGGVLAYLFSGLTIDEAGSFRWLYMVFGMGYIIFLAMIRTIRKIVEIAQKQDKRLRGEE